MAKANAAEPFSIRGFATRMRAVDAAECYPFGGGWMEEEPPSPAPPQPRFPPMDPAPRSRWWKHELAAVRARLAAGTKGGEAAAPGGEGGGPRKGTKRKESRSSSAAERAKKRRRVLQFRSFLKNKEEASKPQSTSLFHQHMLHMALLRKHRSSTVRTRTELGSRKKLDEAWHCILPHENSVNKRSRERMDPCNEMHSYLFGRKEQNSSVNKQGIEISGLTNYPTNTGCEVVKHVTGPKDDIFGDLPLLELESSKSTFRTGVDELPTVIEESFITSQSEADSIPLGLIDASPLEDLVKSEASPDNEPAFVSHNNVAESHPSTVGFNGLPHDKNICVVKPGLGDMQLKFNGSGLSSHSDLRSKCGSSNPLQGCFDANKNCSQEIKKHGTSSTTSSPAMRARTEVTKYKDALVMGKKSTDIFGAVAVVALSAPINHFSSQVSVVPSAVSQGVFNTRTNANDISSFRSMLAKECIPSTRPSGNFRSNVDPCAPPSTDEGKKNTDISGAVAVVALPAPVNHLSSQVSVLPSAVSQGVFNTRTNANDVSLLRSMPAKECIPTTRPSGNFRSNVDPCAPPSTDKGKKNTDISGAGALSAPVNHLSSQVSVLPSAVSQGVFNTRTNANGVSSLRSIHAKECIPSTRPSGNFRSNVDPCARPSTNNQGSWHSKRYPSCSPANIGMAFMKLPGLERMEISNCNVKIDENKFRSAQSMNTERHQKQQLNSGITNVMQVQKKIILNNSQAGKRVLDGCLGQDDHHLQQPTVRLMGKTVSVCNHSKDHNVPTIGKVSPDNVPIEANYLSASSCQLPQKRSFPCQDSVISRVHLNDSSDFLARIPNNSVSGQKTTFSGLHNQRQQSKNTASSIIKERTWNFGSQLVCQAELNKASMVSANSKTRHLELHQPPHLISIPPNQQSHLWTPALRMSTKDHSFLGSAANQCSPVPQLSINASMNEKYQKSTLLSYDDPSSVPIRQPYQIPGEKLSSASVISFLDYGADNSLSRSSSPGLSLSLTTGLANKSVSTGRGTCTGNLTNTDGRKDAGFADPVSNGPAYTDSVSQQPAKRQLVTDRQDFMSMDLNIANHTPGWSLSDAVGPRVLDFSKRIARDVVQTARNESNNSKASSGSVPPIETRSGAGVVAGANTMLLSPGQNLNDHSKLLLYSTNFSVNNGINSVVL